MSNFEQELIEFVNTLEPQMRDQLIEWIDWEKELSWSDGYATAEEQLSSVKYRRGGASTLFTKPSLN